MPDIMQFDSQDEWMKICVPKMMDEGKPQDEAVAACSNMWTMRADAMKYRASMIAVKAVGNWELDVTPVPFHSKDSDRQWFDPNTDIMHEVFATPLVLYQHGIQQGARGMEEKPVVVGKTVPGTLKKKADGWHVRTVLDQTKKQARDIMDAAWKGMVAVSSDSIAHLARLEVGGKLIQYEKNRPGRIAVWPLAGFSLWEKGNGNFNPANQMAVALPAMKAMYREAGLPFPETLDTHGAEPYAEQAAKRALILDNAKRTIEKIKKLGV
jgi:hypothetical protein